MVNVDHLSDSELRTKLMEYGFPALPITSTTRKVMVKKLKLLMENKSGVSSETRRSLGKYSSEDDSDNEVKAAKTKRRATMAAPPTAPIQPKPTLKKTTRIVETTIEEDVPKKETRANTSTSTTFSRASRIMHKTQDEFDTGSESETEIIRNSQNISAEIENKSAGRQYGISSSYGTSKTFDLRESAKNLDNSYSSIFPSSVSDRPAAFSSPISADAASDRINQIRSRLHLGTTGFDRGTSAFSPSTPSSNLGTSADKVDTPFLSNFTRRLSQLSASKGNDHTHRSDTFKEHNTNGATSQSRTTQFTRSTVRPREYQYDYNKANYNSGNLLKDNLVPFTVLGVAVLFFIFVGFIYLGMRSDTSLEPSGKAPMVDDNPYQL